jgi:hypothetical protein
MIGISVKETERFEEIFPTKWKEAFGGEIVSIDKNTPPR